MVTPVPENDAPEKSFVALASPVLETSVSIPSATVAPPNGVAVAASAAGTRITAPTRAPVSAMSLRMIPLSSGPFPAETRKGPMGSRREPSRWHREPGDPERNPYDVPATDETYAATSWICVSVSCPSNGGIAPLP